VNIYIWCNKEQIFQYMSYFNNRKGNDGGKIFMDLLTWHKTNPIPLCSQKYLSDTEYILFFKERGVQLYGSYETKRKWYATPINTADKNQWGHPTIKPLSIVQTLIENSTQPGDVVLDPFMGSGTTAVACIRSGREYLGFEMDPEYYKTCKARVSGASAPKGLDSWGVAE